AVYRQKGDRSMKKVAKTCFVLFCAVGIAVGVMSYNWKGSMAAGKEKEIEAVHKGKQPTPTRLLMHLISSHTSKILDAIMIGDFNAVSREANAIAENSETIMKNFFPEGGQVGEWFKESGKDPKDPEAVKAMKADFEKYLKDVSDAAKDIATTARKLNIVETYKKFDAMLTKSCFACHEEFRPQWPEWPDWMSISGG
ncbi:MAG TPA: cytochrome c, partial [Candidatus Brocadiales bacterium]|nr:cytochrome c [Candidatus Brocadiales bacterium]